ncbi:hypothetical protein WA026_019200 [Henosepilachna vigintioctopunctata]|uniref:Acyltransferase 3 domain-containing protein n=1 Tax=Henosepilachna vigintioctopunctata TaxID=420089 RepID=A0AAW1UVT0_9CUCU
MRFISILWIIAGHGFLTAESIPVINQEVGLNWIHSFYSQYIQSAVFAVDTFFFLSGFLLAFGYLSKMKNRSVFQQITGIPLIYLNRYLRLTPAVGAMFLTSISFYKLLGDGPIWFIAYDMVKAPCTKYWWRFFLYIQNYFPNDLCFTQTWYLSADMQMFVFAPLVLIPCSRYFEKKTRLVVTCLVTLIGVFVGISIAIPYVIEGYQNNYDTHSRVSDYLVGIIGGVLFSKNKGKHFKINKVVNVSLWIGTFGIMIFLAYGNYYVTQFNPTKLDRTLYDAFYRPIWCTCMLWIVFSCYHGYGGFVNWFLSNPLFQVGARLSYCMYVLHGLIVLYSVGITRTPIYFQDYGMINIVWGYINNCIIISIIWTLTFEGPMIMVNKKLFSGIGSGNNKGEPKQDIP